MHAMYFDHIYIQFLSLSLSRSTPYTLQLHVLYYSYVTHQVQKGLPIYS